MMMTAQMNIESAMTRLIKQGTQDSNLKKKFLLRKLKKDAKNSEWENGMRQTLDDEWMLRLCMANLIERNYDWEGWGLREPRDKIIPDIAPWWDGKPVKRLLVLGEQGLGDEILFASMFNEIPCEHITVECDKRLVGIFSRNFPNIEFIGRKHYNEGFWGTDDSEIKEREFDAQTLMGDLPTWYRRSKEDFPSGSGKYLEAEVDSRYLGMTGYSWVGRQGAVDLKPGSNGLSLQYGVEDHIGLLVPDIDLKNDIDGLFSVIAGLDKVISVPTTIVHIAGALGVPTEVYLPKRGMEHGGFGKVNNALNWRFHDRGCDWHPSVKIMGAK